MIKKYKYRISTKYHWRSRVMLLEGDALVKLDELPKSFVNLIITSPPYNIGKEYETKVSIERYIETQEEIISKLIKVLLPDGSLCWQVGNYIQDGEIFPLDIFYYQIFKNKYGLKLRNRIIWKYGHGLHAKNKFSGRYETILWFTKSDNFTFNLDEVRVPAKYPGKRHSKGVNKGKPSGNPLGKNPSDIWDTLIDDWENEIWNIPNVKSNHVEKTDHPCQYPISLAERCILALTNKDDLVLDPFVGTGSSLIAALKNNRRSIGIEKDEKYIKLTRNRIRQFMDGNLKIRPLAKPIYEPNPTNKVTQVPKEWDEIKDSIYKKT